MIYKFNKIIAAIVLVVILFTPVSPLNTNRAKAVVVTVPTFEANPLINAAAAATTKEVTRNWIVFAQKLAGQLLKKLVLDRLVDATINWINGGAQGAIIEDWGKFFEEARQGAVGEVAQELGLGFLCSPINLNVQVALLPVDKFTQQINCTLDDIVGNIDDFMEDFENGGWLAYEETWVPRNNFYGGTIIGWDEADKRQARAEAAARDEAVAGKGFLSFKKCDENGKNCRVTTPGEFVGEAAKQAYIKTPFDSIIGADDIAAYIAAIADAAINKLTKAGIDGLRGSNQPSSSYTNITPSDPCAGLTGDLARACLGLDQITHTSFSSDSSTLINRINGTLEPRLEADTILEEILDRQEELVNSLSALTICRPNDTSVVNEFAVEDDKLAELEDKYESNKTFIDPLQNAINDINNIEGNDWAGLALISENIDPLLDDATAQAFLEEVQIDEEEINANYDAKISSVESRLASCSPTT
ncbi:hypothetical protein GW950_00430 [Candidatus Wolfebacteria bacterium]|nr:hypothetical protein [Candidatus Wolfebacteria bacterium]